MFAPVDDDYNTCHNAITISGSPFDGTDVAGEYTKLSPDKHSKGSIKTSLEEFC